MSFERKSKTRDRFSGIDESQLLLELELARSHQSCTLHSCLLRYVKLITLTRVNPACQSYSYVCFLPTVI